MSSYNKKNRRTIKKRSGLDKKTCQKIHAKKRLRERYDMGTRQFHAISNLTLAHITLAKQNNRLRLKVIEYENKRIYFMYDVQRNQINTFLTEEMAHDSFDFDVEKAIAEHKKSTNKKEKKDRKRKTSLKSPEEKYREIISALSKRRKIV